MESKTFQMLRSFINHLGIWLPYKTVGEQEVKLQDLVSVGTLHITIRSVLKRITGPQQRESRIKKADVSTDQIGARPAIIVVSHVKDRKVLFLRVKTKIRQAKKCRQTKNIEDCFLLEKYYHAICRLLSLYKWSVQTLECALQISRKLVLSLIPFY